MSYISTLKIKNIKTGLLKPYPRNARTHSKKQIHQIAASIKSFGFNNPILIDQYNKVIAGHGRLEAAKHLGIKTVPTVLLDHMSESQKKAYIIADNRLAELAEWDNEILAIELQHLLEVDDLDIEVIGFEIPEIDLIIEEAIQEDDPEDDVFYPDDEASVITKPGDLWSLGDHKLYCGDSLKNKSYSKLMGDEKASFCFTDAPYNVPINGHVGNSGNIKHRDFAMAFGEMNAKQFTEFLAKVFKLMCAYSKDGSIHCQCMDWRHMTEIQDAGNIARYKLKNICVWVKDNGGMGSFYRSRHEFVFIFKNGNAPHINNIQLGKYGRYRTNVWEYAGVNTMRRDRMEELAMHPTVKPVVMIVDAIKDSSKPNDIILDPFGGSGSTLIASERTKRKARLIEIDPQYCDVIINRWQKLTGLDAINVNTGQRFNQISGEDNE